MPSQTELIIYAIIRSLLSLSWVAILLFALIAYLRIKRLSLLLLTLGSAIILLNILVGIALPYALRYFVTTGSSSYSSSYTYLVRIPQIVSIVLSTPGTLLFTIGFIMEMLRHIRSAKPTQGFPIESPSQP